MVRILSWDVGIKNLAYCLLEQNENKITILDWKNINLIENSTDNLKCCGHLKNGQSCKSKPLYSATNLKNKTCGYCKKHSVDFDDAKILEKIDGLFQQSNNCICNFINKKDEECGKKAKFEYNGNYLCAAHKKSENAKLIKKHSLVKIKKNIAKGYSTEEIQLSIVNKLDELMNIFIEHDVTEVVIENQPSYKNPRMKSISNTLFDYFLIRGKVDKKLNIKKVCLQAPNNKLKINNDNTLEVLSRTKENKKYKMTKNLGIDYTKIAIKDQPDMLEFLDSKKKKDDLCDSYLQGRYYLEIKRLK